MLKVWFHYFVYGHHTSQSSKCFVYIFGVFASVTFLLPLQQLSDGDYIPNENNWYYYPTIVYHTDVHGANEGYYPTHG